MSQAPCSLPIKVVLPVGVEREDPEGIPLRPTKHRSEWGVRRANGLDQRRIKSEDSQVLFEIARAPSLTGIARLAAESDVLESKKQVEYFELPARSLLNRSKPNMPFRWTINPYRGCEFGCKYCYARYTHEFMGMEDAAEFEQKIYAKAEVAALLRRELRRTPAEDGIAIGTATDPYQPAERRFGRTRSILQVFAGERGRRVSIVTKSDLVARDIDLLREAARRHVLSVNITITTLDDDLARLLEPRAPRPALRLAAVEKLADAGIPVGVFPNPILPLLTDSEASLDSLAQAARAHGARHFGGGLLFLMPSAQKVFFPFLEARYPELLPAYRRAYAKNAYLRGEYAARIRERVRAVRERHGLASSPFDYVPELWQGRQQGTLF
jgi:DNA repair photolyase